MTTSEATQLRREARRLVIEIDQRFWDLGRILYEVYGTLDGPHSFTKGTGANTQRRRLFQELGYSNFGEFCEMEIGLRRRTAENLRFVYQYFVIKQQIPSSVIDQLISIGRSKTYLLAGFATKSNIATWIKKAKDLSHDDLKMEIRAARNGDKTAKKGPPKRRMAHDIRVLAKYLCDMEAAIKRGGKKIPAEIQTILQWYKDNAGVKTTLKLVA